MTDPIPHRPLRPGDYVWPRHPSGPGYQLPGQVISPHGDGWVFVHWLHDYHRDRVHPMPMAELVYAEHDPDRFNVLEDRSGADLPAVLQQGGQLWHAVLFGLRHGPLQFYANRHDIDDATDNIMVSLAAVLAPVLTARDDAEVWLRRFTRTDLAPWPPPEEIFTQSARLLTALGATCHPDHIGPMLNPPGEDGWYCLTCQTDRVTIPANAPPGSNDADPNSPAPEPMASR